jgi:integrase
MRRVLGTCGNWAERQGHLLKGTNPFLGMMRYKEEKAAVSIFTPEQIDSLLKKADAALRPYLAIGAFAGLRTAELHRLDWSEIDLDRGFITVAASKAKTRRRRLVPISDNLKLWLTPIRQASGPKKGLENFIEHSRRYSRSRIGHTDLHVTSRLGLDVHGSVLLVQNAVLDADGQVAAVGHGIPGVHAQVQKNLMHLGGVSKNGPDIIRNGEL